MLSVHQFYKVENIYTFTQTYLRKRDCWNDSAIEIFIQGFKWDRTSRDYLWTFRDEMFPCSFVPRNKKSCPVGKPIFNHLSLFQPIDKWQTSTEIANLHCTVIEPDCFTQLCCIVVRMELNDILSHIFWIISYQNDHSGPPTNTTCTRRN